MDKIAIISDIHGNLPALQAVLADIARREIRRIVCLGDLVGKGPEPAAAVDLVRDACETVVQGNWDIGITYPQMHDAGIWQQRQLGEERLAYLAQLPFSADFLISGRRLRLFHASAQSVFHRVNRKASKQERQAMFHNTEQTGTPAGGAAPEIVGYGDIHIPYLLTLKTPQDARKAFAKETGAEEAASAGSPVQPLAAGAGRGLLLFNAGSVGVPYDGIPLACYAIVEGAVGLDGAANAAQCGFSVQFVRVPYDIQRAAQAAQTAGMPDCERYIKEITTGLVHKK